jgi:hypothetical protein
MARLLSDETGVTEVKTYSRTQRVEFRCDLYLQGNYQLAFHREKAMYVNGVAMSVGPLREVVRNFAAIATQTVTLPDGTVLSVQQVAAAVALLGDTFDSEDAAAEG